ncbi:DUF732 domain-containing protein [Allostreptomyces psammosilenae]|uniref:DUF732 domain-containing protein n=1 Tax=Allostreptomyces psammosilenae TaxID=1892865 RepID=A0A852ZP71_9ACTN|nr:DUF732 domain-containing protein [Allostreptomyces psammosilenae]NYI03257.1 hypothetical protein [Allostreptomyces psammosilenae]
MRIRTMTTVAACLLTTGLLVGCSAEEDTADAANPAASAPAASGGEGETEAETEAEGGADEGAAEEGGAEETAGGEADTTEGADLTDLVDEDQLFLQTTRDTVPGVEGMSDDELIQLGHDVCTSFENGDDMLTVTGMVSDEAGLDQIGSSTFIGVSIGSYCIEQQANMLG